MSRLSLMPLLSLAIHCGCHAPYLLKQMKSFKADDRLH
jgi:hypothetical protein